MAQIFRKSLIDKLSSPEQLDKMIVITPPSFWIALSGAGLIIIVAIIWGFCGQLPVNVNSNGIYINSEGTSTIYSETSGVVEEVLVQDGDEVSVGDVIAVVNTDEIDEKIADYEERIEALQNITLTSVGDTINSDSTNLVEIKNQLITVRQTLNSDLALLSLRTNELAQYQANAKTLEDEYLAAEDAYFKSLYVDNANEEQQAYSEAQSALSSAGSALQSAASNLAQYSEAYSNAYNAYEEVRKPIYEAAYNAYKEGHKDDADVEEKAIEAGNNAVDAALASSEDMQKLYQAMLTAQANYNEAQNTYDSYKSAYDSAEKTYNSKRDAYLKKAEEVNTDSQKSSELGNRYSAAMNSYSTAKNNVTSLEDTVAQLKTQVGVDQQNLSNQIEVITNQFNASKQASLTSLQTELDNYKKQKDNAQIKATSDGTISNLSVSVGGVLQQGSEVAKVQLGDINDNVIVLYVPVSSGRKIYEGMEVMVYPSTVNKQEYGHMEATVISVSSYVASEDDMLRQLGDSQLVSSFTSDGPVVEVVCELKTDENTSSGYYWSSKKGKNLTIENGTIVSADVVVERKAPITMLIPYIKEKLTVKTEN